MVAAIVEEGAYFSGRKVLPNYVPGETRSVHDCYVEHVLVDELVSLRTVPTES